MHNWVLLILTALGVAAAAGCGFLSHAPNRIVPGQHLLLYDIADGSILVALAAVGSCLLVTALVRPGRTTSVVTGLALFAALVLVLAAAGSGAAALANPDVPASRTSLGPAFWLMAAAIGLAFMDLFQQAQLSARSRLFLNGAIATAIWGITAAGWLDALSLAREYHARSDVFSTAVRQHVILVAITALIATSAGVPLGVMAAGDSRLRTRVFGILNIVQTVPSIALFGLIIGPLSSLSNAVPWLRAVGISGIGTTPALIALVVYALLPLVRNTVTGIDAVPSATLDAARGIGMGPNRILFLVTLPLALPVILVGLRVVIIQTIGLAVVAALIGAGGLGSFVFQGLGQNALDLVLLGVIPTILLALAVDAAFSVLVASQRPVR